MTPERLLVWFLRATAITLLFAAPAVLLPHAWMDTVHRELGLGGLPDSPMVGYLTRSISALYAAIGLCFWHVASDVGRYLPLLRLTVPVTITFSIVLVAVDFASEMPGIWTFVEAFFLVSWCVANAWLVSRQKRDG